MTVSFVEPVDLLLPLSKYSVGINSLQLDIVSQLSKWSDDMGTREEGGAAVKT